MRLKDKVIIVTGSTTGIGEAIARRCLAEGARVLVHGRNRERGERVVSELGDGAILHIDDLADPEAPPRVVGAAVRAFGRLDGIVNNAAYVVRSDLYTTDVELFDKVVGINVRAPFLMIRAGIDQLKRVRGAVVNIVPGNAYSVEPRQLACSKSKGALVTIPRNLANALAGDHVRVTHFNVGWVITPNEYELKMTEGLPPGWPDRPDLEHVPTGRMTQPEEIAAHAVFWLSDESRPISGSVIDLEQYPVIGRNPLKEGGN
jgi:NAD(P)-dependent dehydrogenase (short-subunit alcohol dehydrogenase family)